ncbi:MAG: M28 family peptidase [Flavobacteriaceae bacterium]|jgi:leucyl aminopeptidase|nr:M28 family peptidase [Flavobacteriaceae bacterium]
MKKSLIVLLVLILSSCVNQSSYDQESIRDQITTKETKEILFALANDDMIGRDSNSGGYFKAASYVIEYFKKYNITSFYEAYRDSLVTDSIVSFNVVGQIGKYTSERKTILIGAHLDHIGIQDIEGDNVFNGANDNASGSTAVMQISRFLAQHSWDKNIIIALFADEEKGLKGAHHLANRLKDENVDLTYMINFEMIGTVLTSGENQVYVTGHKISSMADDMNKVSPNFVQFLPEAKELNLFRRSDNYAFFKAFNIPAQTISSFDFKNFDFYHKPGDEPERLAIDNMNKIIGTSAYTIAKLLEKNTSIKLFPKEEE